VFSRAGAVFFCHFSCSLYIHVKKKVDIKTGKIKTEICDDIVCLSNIEIDELFLYKRKRSNRIKWHNENLKTILFYLAKFPSYFL
jgi:hypothetical protein